MGGTVVLGGFVAGSGIDPDSDGCGGTIGDRFGGDAEGGGEGCYGGCGGGKEVGGEFGGGWCCCCCGECAGLGRAPFDGLGECSSKRHL